MRIRFLASLFIFSTFVGPVLAQQGKGLEEIVVTAQRRQQSLQQVPISVTAFSGATITQMHMTEASEYLQMTPNVSYTEDGQVGARGISIAMRGVSNINTDESAFIQSIGIYLDGFSVSSSANATVNPQLLDLQRVEVLRGPQGTYFGRNSVGGALNITTQKPTDKFGYKISAGGQGYEYRGAQYNVSGIVNIPINNSLMVRADGYYEKNTGIVKNIVPGGGNSGHNYEMGRLAVRWLPTDNTTVNWMMMYTNEHQGIAERVPAGVWDTDTIATFFLNNPSGTTFSSALNDGEGFWPQNQSKVAHTAIGELNNNNSLITVLNIENRLSDSVTLKSITGLIDTRNEKVFDNDLVPENLVNRYQAKNGQSWSEELRLEINKERYEWTTGFLYAHDKIKKGPFRGKFGVVTGNTTAVDLAPSLAPVPGGNPDVPNTSPGVVDFALVGALPPLFDLGGGFHLYNLTPNGQLPLCLQCDIRGNKISSWAVFSDATWHATSKWDLTFGFRFTSDNVADSFADFGLFRFPRIPDPSDPTGLTPLPVTDSKTFTDFAPRFVVGYQATDDVRFYATISKGYKAGGFSLGFNAAANGGAGAPFDEEFKPEILWNYEVGMKSEWLNHRLRVNLDGFHLDWYDLQLESFFFAVPGDATSNIQKTLNVKHAQADGFEAEFAAVPTERLSISGGLGYTTTEILSNEIAQLSGNLFVHLHHEPLPRAPEWTWGMTADYHWPWAGHKWYLRGEWIYRSGQFSTIEDVTFQQTSNAPVPANPLLPATGSNVVAQVPDRSSGFPFKSPSYNLINLHGGVHWTNGLTVDLFVYNLFNKKYYTGTGENFGLSGFRLRPHPRYFGGQVSYSYGGI